MTGFPLTLTRTGAWIIQQLVRPGVPLGHMMEGSPVHLWQQYAMQLREKVNNTLLRFEDEPETKQIDIDVTREEAWLLDQNINVDMGMRNDGADILLQLFRGLWTLDNPGLPRTMAIEPEIPSADIIKDLLDTRWNDKL